MSVSLTEKLLQDDIAIAVARAVGAANRKARELGVEISNCLIGVTQAANAGKTAWHVSYGPKDHAGRRGGDLIIEVQSDNETIGRVFRGQ